MAPPRASLGSDPRPVGKSRATPALGPRCGTPATRRPRRCRGRRLVLRWDQGSRGGDGLDQRGRVMFDEETARRLDRFERDASRRRWDSTIMTAAQRGSFERATNAPPGPSATAERPLMDLVSERFDHIERANRRLEWQLN